MDPLNTNPVTSGSQIPPPQPPKSSVGPMAGAVIIILLLVAGGLYFWGAKINENMGSEVPYIPSNDTWLPEDESSTITSDSGAGLPPQSASDDISSIEVDAAAMDVGRLESQNSAELNNI